MFEGYGDTSKSYGKALEGNCEMLNVNGKALKSDAEALNGWGGRLRVRDGASSFQTEEARD